MTASRDRLPDWLESLPLFALAVGLAALGALSIATGDFAFQWQPVAADVPARRGLAIAFGLLEMLAGVLVLPARTRRIGTLLAAVALAAWTALHVPSVASRPGSLVDWLGLAESAAMAAAVLSLAAAGRKPGGAASGRVGVVVFGLSAVVFGASHFVYADFTASMIPAWLPQRVALAYLTGASHALAGLAITFGVLRVLAAGLEALMMLSFVVLVHASRVAVHPESRMEWTMLLVAVMLSASAAVIALTARRRAA